MASYKSRITHYASRITNYASRVTRRIPRISLVTKLLGAFILVVVVAVVAVVVMSRQSAKREFTRFIWENRSEPSEDLMSELTAFYNQAGDWSGVEDILGENDLGAWAKDETRTPFLLLVDAQGRIVAHNWGPEIGEQAPQNFVDYGWSIQVDGETIGTLVTTGNRHAPPPPEAREEWLDPEGAETVARVLRGILIGGLIAGGVALVIAGALAWRLVRPLRRLTAAAEGIAQGDLSQRVPVTSGDEVGELAATFNYMATELERAEHLRRNMTADVAHELRTPLSVVRGKLEGMLDGVYPTTPEHLELILESTELLTYLVEDLRLLAQAEAGQLTLEKRALKVDDLLRDAQVNFDPQASDRGVTLSLDLPLNLPQVKADWHRIVQVLGNLLTNALRHTSQGGYVTLAAATNDDGVKITVTDTGSGIPADELSYVFDRFWRGEKSRSRAGGGSGLGLAIAKQLIELHGGTIGVESTSGQGSTFWFALPDH